MCSYIILNGVPWIIGKLTSGRLLPPTIDAAEEWVIPPGGIIPPWMCVVSLRDIFLRTNMLGRRKLIGKPLVLDEHAMEEMHPRSSVDTASQDHVVASTKGASVDEK